MPSLIPAPEAQMPIIYRPSTLDELETIDALVVSSINDLTERHGFGQMASPSRPRFAQFSLRDDVRGFWTAEENGEPVGFSFAWACDDFWFLAQLFVKTALQRNGSGRELLKRNLEHASLVGATQRALITFAFNTVSQGLYIRHGFAPRFLIYSMSGPVRAATGLGALVLDPAPMGGSDPEIAQFVDVDRQALGFSREKHHRFLVTEPAIRAFGLHDKGRLVGYAYVSESGHIGPLAVIAPNFLESAFTTALSLAAHGATENLSCFIPGPNVSLLRGAMAQGLRMKFPMLMMSTSDVGELPCYLPRNPGFM